MSASISLSLPPPPLYLSLHESTRAYDLVPRYEYLGMKLGYYLQNPRKISATKQTGFTAYAMLDLLVSYAYVIALLMSWNWLGGWGIWQWNVGVVMLTPPPPTNNQILGKCVIIYTVSTITTTLLDTSQTRCQLVKGSAVVKGGQTQGEEMNSYTWKLCVGGGIACSRMASGMKLTWGCSITLAPASAEVAARASRRTACVCARERERLRLSVCVSERDGGRETYSRKRKRG